MKNHNILLGDQLKNSIKLCTQNMGVLFGFKGRSLDDDLLSKRSLLELNFLTTPFLYYLSKTRLETTKQTINSLVDALMIYRSANGSFDNNKFNIARPKGDVLDTALSVINLVKIDQLNKTNHQKDILDAIQWLIDKTHIIKNKNEISLDSLVSCYTILHIAGLYEDRSLVKSVVEKLQPLRFYKSIKHISATNPSLDQEIIYPLGIRMLIEIANLSGHEHFYNLASESLDESINSYDILFQFLREGKVNFFKSKKINLGAASLWAYNYLQIYSYNQYPELIEYGTSLLRLVSDSIIEAHFNNQLLIPKYFDIKKGEHSDESSISYIRFFLDASELAKEYISSSDRNTLTENIAANSKKRVRYEA